MNQFSKIRFLKIFFIVALFFVLPNFSQAAIIFEDNFDAQADWQPRAGMNDISPAGAVVACDYGENCTGKMPPIGWTQYRSTGLWWGPTYQDTLRIKSSAADGTPTDRQGKNGGKALIDYLEANIGASGDGWGADGILAKLFDQEYPEIYVQMWVRTQSNFNSGTYSMGKFLHFYHYDKAGEFFKYFSNGNAGPIYVYQNKYSDVYGTRYSSAVFCDPQETLFYCPDNSGVAPDNNLVADDWTSIPTDPGMIADTNWHRLDFQLKMNTYNSSTSTWNTDGILRYWYDGNLREDYSSMQWKYAGSDPAIGWNTVSFGGNYFNNYNSEWVNNHLYNADDVIIQNSYTWKALQTHTSSDSTYPTFTSTAYWQNMGLIAGQKEQWYAIDDVVVSTTAIPANYTIGAADVLAPSAPTGLGVL